MPVYGVSLISLNLKTLRIESSSPQCHQVAAPGPGLYRGIPKAGYGYGLFLDGKYIENTWKYNLEMDENWVYSTPIFGNLHMGDIQTMGVYLVNIVLTILIECNNLRPSTCSATSSIVSIVIVFQHLSTSSNHSPCQIIEMCITWSLA
jgi:hypothetical protein